MQIVRDWVVKFNAHGPEGLVNRKPPGQPSKLTDAHRAALQAIIEQGPIPAIHGVVRWRLVDLIAWVWEEFRITISKQTLSRELRAMNYRGSRPVRAITRRTRRRFPLLKNFPARLEEIAKAEAHGKVIEIWFADEARIGQKNRSRDAGPNAARAPSAPKDQRTASAYIFGAICPAEGKGAGLVLPRCTTEGMTLHLKEISQAVTPGAHALVLVDQAGWHRSKKLVVPDNITLMPLPAKAPELNPVENIWQFLRENWISNRIFSSYGDIVRHITRRWIPFAERRGLEDMTLGPTAYLAAKAKGDRSMPSKRERSEDADDPVPQGPRDTVRTGLFEPQPPTMQPYIPRHSVLRRGHRDGRQGCRRSNLPRGGRWDLIPFKGANEAPTSRSTRPAPRECGIARRAARRRATEPP